MERKGLKKEAKKNPKIRVSIIVDFVLKMANIRDFLDLLVAEGREIIMRGRKRYLGFPRKKFESRRRGGKRDMN